MSVILNVLNDDDPEGLTALIREFESEGDFCDTDGFVHVVTILDQETGEELAAFRKVFNTYTAAFKYAKKATNNI